MDAVLDKLAFTRDGFGVVRRAVPASLLAALKDAAQRVQDIVPALPPHLLERLTFERDLNLDRRGGIASSAVGDAIFILGDPVAFDDVFWEVLHQPRIVSAIQEAVGTQNLAAHFMNITIKHPRFGRSIAWHRDYPNAYACPPGSCFVRVMLCLDGMSEAAGATAFIPGSHHLDDAAAREQRKPIGWQPLDSEVARVCCDPGDLVVIHPKVLHGGGMNTSAGLRRNLILQAGDAEAPLQSLPEPEGVAGYRLAAR